MCVVILKGSCPTVDADFNIISQSRQAVPNLKSFLGTARVVWAYNTTQYQEIWLLLTVLFHQLSHFYGLAMCRIVSGMNLHSPSTGYSSC